METVCLTSSLVVRILSKVPKLPQLYRYVSVSTNFRSIVQRTLSLLDAVYVDDILHYIEENSKLPHFMEYCTSLKRACLRYRESMNSSVLFDLFASDSICSNVSLQTTSPLSATILGFKPWFSKVSSVFIDFDQYDRGSFLFTLSPHNVYLTLLVKRKHDQLLTWLKHQPLVIKGVCLMVPGTSSNHLCGFIYDLFQILSRHPLSTVKVDTKFFSRHSCCCLKHITSSVTSLHVLGHQHYAKLVPGLSLASKYENFSIAFDSKKFAVSLSFSKDWNEIKINTNGSITTSEVGKLQSRLEGCFNLIHSSFESTNSKSIVPAFIDRLEISCPVQVLLKTIPPFLESLKISKISDFPISLICGLFSKTRHIQSVLIELVTFTDDVGTDRRLKPCRGDCRSTVDLPKWRRKKFLVIDDDCDCIHALSLCATCRQLIMTSCFADFVVPFWAETEFDELDDEDYDVDFDQDSFGVDLVSFDYWED
ncbi:hypothetical protein RCL1_002607 [Eukaryota sp. TZLM3-RCL]